MSLIRTDFHDIHEIGCDTWRSVLGSENAMIIDGIYRDLLQRPVDQESLGFWLDGLENATITEEEIRNQVSNSTEKKMLEFNSLSIDEQLMIISNEHI